MHRGKTKLCPHREFSSVFSPSFLSLVTSESSVTKTRYSIGENYIHISTKKTQQKKKYKKVNLERFGHIKAAVPCLSGAAALADGAAVRPKFLTGAGV